MVVTVSHKGYIKRVPLDSYRAQRRGGKGKSGMKTRDEDFVTRLFIANTHTPILFFTSSGIVHQLKCFKLPETSPTSMGKAMINLLPISNEENIQTIMPMPNETEKWDSLSVVFATSSGSIRRNRLSDFTNIRANGKIAMKLGASDRLIGVVPCTDDSDIILATNKGKAIRFATKDLRVFNSRDSMGVRGIKLKEGDHVVSLSVLTNDEREFILAVTENGFGKRSKSSEYRKTGRGGQGIANIEISKKNGNVVASFPVLEGEQLMLATDQGKIIRISVDGGDGNTIRVAGRKTQGVNLFTLSEGEKVVSVDRVKEEEDEEEDWVLPNDFYSKTMREKIAVYPGTFDPFTFGHLDVVKRSSKLFDKIIVSVAENNNKSALFNLDERIKIISDVISNEKDLNKIEIRGFKGLLVDHVIDVGAVAVLRGLRALSDFEYEFQMAGINTRLSSDFETIFLMASENQQFVASRFVKEIHSLGGDVSSFVPKIVMDHLESKKK